MFQKFSKILCTAIGLAPETLGETVFIALLLTVGVIAVNIVPVYNVYTSNSKAIETYRLLTGYSS